MPEPKVRFKRDDGSSYPVWTAGKLGDITEKVDRKAPKGSTAPVMMVSQGNGFIYQADKYSRENAGQSLKNYTLLKQGEFAYNHGASKAKPYGVAYCLTEESEARVPFVYHTFRIADGVNPFWHEALNTSKMDRQLKRLVSSGARMDGLLNINYDTYMDVDVNIPCIEEQQKIAEFLSSVDEVIAASEKEVANLETQKKAVMKKIFSQEVRFKRDDGTEFPAWESYQLKNLVSEISDVDHYMPQSVDDGIPYVMTSNLIDGGYSIDFESCKRISYDDYLRLSKKSNPQIGDIIFARYATIGTVHLIKTSQRFVVSYSCVLVKCGHNIDNNYLYQFFKSDTFSEAIKKEIKTGSQANIGKSELHNCLVPLPSLEEQRLIADFLSDFDEAIAAAKKELDLWKELKKGLLQQMFV